MLSSPKHDAGQHFAHGQICRQVQGTLRPRAHDIVPPNLICALRYLAVRGDSLTLFLCELKNVQHREEAPHQAMDGVPDSQSEGKFSR